MRKMTTNGQRRERERETGMEKEKKICSSLSVEKKSREWTSERKQRNSHKHVSTLNWEKEWKDSLDMWMARVNDERRMGLVLFCSCSLRLSFPLLSFFLTSSSIRKSNFSERCCWLNVESICFKCLHQIDYWSMPSMTYAQRMFSTQCPDKVSSSCRSATGQIILFEEQTEKKSMS